MLGTGRKFEPGSPLHMIEAAYFAVASIGLLHGRGVQIWVPAPTYSTTMLGSSTTEQLTKERPSVVPGVSIEEAQDGLPDDSC